MKTKVLISFAVTAKLICVFVFAYAKSQFSQDAAQTMLAKLAVWPIFFYMKVLFPLKELSLLLLFDISLNDNTQPK